MGFALRGIAHAPAVAILCASALQGWIGIDRFAARATFWSTATSALAVWMAVLLLRPAWLLRAPRGLLKTADLLLFDLALVLVLSEAGLALWERIGPSPLLWNQASPASLIEAHRLEPGSERFGFPVDSGGFYDPEFRDAGEHDLVVALLSDSFGVGVVPHDRLFGSIAQARLAALLGDRSRRVIVQNYAVNAVGMPEYAWILEHVAEAHRPAIVLLCVFVGNDIASLGEPRPRRFYSLQHMRIGQLVERLVRVWREQSRSEAGGKLAARATRTWDSSESRPTFSEAAFFAIESARIEYANPRSSPVRRNYRAFFRWLEHLRERAGERLRVVVIPDEYQVDDALWKQLLAEKPVPAAYDRTLPQRRITAFCEKRGIPALDLLPELRAASRDGPTYWPRNTHWNTRGNRVAGEAIARFLRQTLPPAAPAAGVAARR